jgi:carotenoid cleavage dioxygenase
VWLETEGVGDEPRHPRAGPAPLAAVERLVDLAQPAGQLVLEQIEEQRRPILMTRGHSSRRSARRVASLIECASMSQPTSPSAGAAESSDLNVTNPYLNGPYAPVEREFDADCDLEVTGELPRDLHGMYVRNGPNPRYRPTGKYHWFDGDGMLHAIRFEDGRARYCNRWVRTEHLADEDAAGKALWTGLLHSVAKNPRKSPYKDSANTDVVVFGGELLTTWYICGLPYRVDPSTLETRGVHAFGQDRPRRISAHAKVDPVTGELIYFSYGMAPKISYSVVSAGGELAHDIDIPLPGPRLPHDMAITENYSILMDLPLFFTEQAVRQGRWRVSFRRDIPARFAVIPRRGGADDVRWFEADPCYIYHTVNAWEEGNEVVMIACKVLEPLPAPEYERDGFWAHMMANLRVRARLVRWRFNLDTGATLEEPIDDRSSEFPTMNMSRLGRRTRYAYNMSIPDTPTLLLDGLIKYDTDTGKAESHDFGPGRHGSEAVFAPRSGSGASAPIEQTEDDGYVLTMVSDAREGRSEVLVYDARAVSAGPMVRVRLPQRVPLGFHACWMPGGQL